MMPRAERKEQLLNSMISDVKRATRDAYMNARGMHGVYVLIQGAKKRMSAAYPEVRPMDTGMTLEIAAREEVHDYLLECALRDAADVKADSEVAAGMARLIKGLSKTGDVNEMATQILAAMKGER